MKRFLIGLYIALVIDLLAFLVIYYFGEYEIVSFMIISFMSGIFGQLIMEE